MELLCNLFGHSVDIDVAVEMGGRQLQAIGAEIEISGNILEFEAVQFVCRIGFPKQQVSSTSSCCCNASSVWMDGHTPGNSAQFCF